MQLPLKISHQLRYRRRVTAKAERRDQRVEGRLGAFVDVVAECLAPTADPGVGIDTYQQRVHGRPQLAAEAGGRPTLPIGQPHDDRFDAGDLHGARPLRISRRAPRMCYGRSTYSPYQPRASTI